jgi:hypothetical protein
MAALITIALQPCRFCCGPRDVIYSIGACQARSRTSIRGPQAFSISDAKGSLPCLEDGVFSVLSIMGMLHVPGKPVCVSSPLAPSPPTALRAGGVTRSRLAPSNSTTWSCPSLTITRNNLCSKPHDDANAMQSCRAISHQLGDVFS